MTKRRKHWGWGFEEQQPGLEDQINVAKVVQAVVGMGTAEVESAAPLESIDVAAPRVEVPASLAAIASTNKHDRVFHSHGSAYRDVVRAFRGQIDRTPDVVVRPQKEQEIEQVLEWASSAEVAVIPFGGGTSVVGGVEPRDLDRFEGVVSLDMCELCDVLEIDATSRAARIQAGAFGPALEQQLSQHGMTLRHFPQSFEYSTLGGWLATRAGGHFASQYTHIDDLTESIRAITPTGEWQSRRLPGSGAGPSPDRMMLGSEGALGVITEAWMRVQAKPKQRRSASVMFDDFDRALEAVRAISQDGLNPSNCRLIDAEEARMTGAGSGDQALLVLGFEAAERPVDGQMTRALELARAHGGETAENAAQASGDGSSNAWRSAFLQIPYLRDTLVAMGLITETFETSITWDRLPQFCRDVKAAIATEIAERCDAPGIVTCRLTHVYPDGAAPYFTVLAQGERGEEVAQWDAIKAVAGRTLNDLGGTITHHHAVGRDHMPWYTQQIPDRFSAALAAAKSELDPNGVMNPGVLI